MCHKTDPRFVARFEALGKVFRKYGIAYFVYRVEEPTLEHPNLAIENDGMIRTFGPFYRLSHPAVTTVWERESAGSR